MEQDANKTLPSSSPLLGFGNTTQTHLPRLGWWALVGAAAALLLAAALVYFPLSAKLLPADAPVLAVAKGGSQLPDLAPDVWRQAARSTSWPVIFGVAKSDQGFASFAVTSRFAVVSSAWHESTGLFTIWSDKPLILDHRLGFGFLAGSSFNLIWHPMFLSVDAGELAADKTLRISGPVQDGKWQTDLALPQGQGLQSSDADVLIDTQIMPEAWPAISQALKPYGIETDDLPVPSLVGWKYTDSDTPDIVLGFTAPPSSATLLKLASAAGLYDVVPYQLQDGTQALELKPPVGEIQALASSTPDMQKQTNFWLKNGNLIAGSTTQSQTEQNSCSPGGLIFKLSKNAVSKVFQSWNIANPTFNSFEIHDQDGRATVCIN